MFMNIQPMDWSATAAWIALVISVIGTIAGPIITALITNNHQLKLRKLDIDEKQISEYSEHRRYAIENFLSSTSKYLSDCQYKNIEVCGENFFQVYSYVPQNLWEPLNTLYSYICEENIVKARALFLELSNQLSEILTEPPQISH